MTIYRADAITRRSQVSPVNVGTVLQQKAHLSIAADSSLAATDIIELLVLPASCTLVSLRLVNVTTVTDSEVTLTAGLMSGNPGEDYDTPDLGSDPSVARTIATEIGTGSAIASANDEELLSVDNGNLFTDYSSDEAQSIGVQFSAAFAPTEDFELGIIAEYRSFQNEDAE